MKGQALSLIQMTFLVKIKEKIWSEKKRNLFYFILKYRDLHQTPMLVKKILSCLCVVHYILLIKLHCLELNNINFIPSGYVNSVASVSTHSVTNSPKSNLAKQIYNKLQQNQQQLQQPPSIVESIININDTNNDNQNTITIDTNVTTLSSSSPIPFSSTNIDALTTSPNSTQQHQTSNQPQPQPNEQTQQS
jgi:hypothetical protein